MAKKSVKKVKNLPNKSLSTHNIKYDRKDTVLEAEIKKRGMKSSDIWRLVTAKGKGFTQNKLNEIMDNQQYTLGTQHLENIAVACGVTFMQVVDWIRLSREPEKMSLKEFNLYKHRMVQMDNADRVRWYWMMLCTKKIPVLYVLEEVLKKANFKVDNGWINRKDYIYSKYIATGKFNPNPDSDSEDS